ncbi:septation protein SepH [Aestuariimicrobium ganziense]|uniref:septation protein SepH n=1 Tax=Aestuariimicrobium ganziense TaxID=2773677 RepID=UPI002E27E6AB|nr:septation protein SepH [Aestuariimicrobium ganziense]
MRFEQETLEIAMQSELSPREIQTRIRSGESLDEVARAAGVPADQIEVYAAPVIAELEHVAGSALAAAVRRSGESSSARSLRAVVAERLQQRGIDIDDVTWQAWRDPDRRWTVRGEYASGSAQHEALFTYDVRGRYSVARNDEARWLINESGPSHGPQPGRKRRDPDQEPTVDLNDELALVRAIQPDTEERPVTAPVADADEPEDYSEAELSQVDGVYDIIPPQSQMDVLYEMLSSFNEDSVNIYAGLTQPVVEDDLAPVVEEPTPAEEPPLAEEPTPVGEPATSVPKPASTAEPEQDSLLEAENEPTLVRPREGKAKSRRKRAQVPSWDEIMFGGPKKDPKD